MFSPFAQFGFVGGSRSAQQSRGWIPELSGLRVVAIGAVFLFHLSIELMLRSGLVVPVGAGSGWLARVVGNGDRGVDLFFVLSGLVVGLPFARHSLLGEAEVPVGRFFLRRLKRLEIPFLASVGISALMAWVWGHGMEPSLRSLLATVFYLHGTVLGAMAPFDVVTWTLEVEVQFYLLAPLLMQWYRLPGVALRRGSMVAAILAIGLLQLPYGGDMRVHLSVLYFLQYFVSGMLVADWLVLREGSEAVEGVAPNLWDGVGVAAFGIVFWVSNENAWVHGVIPLVVALVCAAAVRGAWLGRIFRSRWVAGVGAMCYSIYLLHFQLMAAVFKVTRGAIVPGLGYGVNLALQMVVTGIPVFALCVAFFLLVERPCLDAEWRARVWGWATYIGKNPSAEAMRDGTV